ncbi:hypothetical protein BFAG_00207 [Bacteroides fragilis 3_1_12]|uniref:Transmembrane protein n=1 Tax=Bacteroides fragilis 3_1_12 TaxID=457424 RepID=A0ABN0BFG9_BACFG|nr:hypothetical protein BFAG_00207 [Bacteroides fragilis 3_1_12]
MIRANLNANLVKESGRSIFLIGNLIGKGGKRGGPINLRMVGWFIMWYLLLLTLLMLFQKCFLPVCIEQVFCI